MCRKKRLVVKIKNDFFFFLYINKLLKNIEKVKIPISFLYIYIIIFLRNFIEYSFSDIGIGFIMPIEKFFFHYTFFYILSFLFLIIILNIVTKEKITKITRIFIVFFPLILIAPIIDIFLGGADMKYLYFNNFKDYFLILINFFYIHPYGQITTGIFVETTIVFIMFFLYNFIKTKKLLKSFTATLVSYFIIKSLGSMPSLIKLLINIDIKKSNNIFLRQYEPDIQISLFLYLFIFIALIIYFFLYNKKKFMYFLKYISITRILHYLLIFYAGILVTSSKYKINFNYLEYLLIIVSSITLILMWILSKTLNDYYDQKEDKLTNIKNPFLNNLFNKDEIFNLYLIIILLIVNGALIIDYSFFYLYIIILSLTFLYCVPPFKLKKYIFLSHGIIALVSGIFYLVGCFLIKDFSYLDNNMSKYFFNIIIIFFFGSHLKDIKDYEGDKIANIYTIPTIFGLKYGKLIISILISYSFIISVFIFNAKNFLLLSILLSIIIIYLINIPKKYNEKIIFTIYFIYNILLIYNIIKYLL